MTEPITAEAIATPPGRRTRPRFTLPAALCIANAIAQASTVPDEWIAAPSPEA
ncbi:hypothetical protein D3C72_774350 [compost metagenome]